MARIIVKIPYVKAGKSLGSFINYIANREGVDRSVNQRILIGKPTERQMAYIKELLKAYPDAEESYEYEDYIENPTKQNASAFISIIEEQNPNFFADREKYLDYIAKRPNVEKRGNHGLFGKEEQVEIKKVKAEIKEHDGVVWIPIISLRREDAAKLGYDRATAWRDLLQKKQMDLAKIFGIPFEDFRWYGAFHNEGHHPHIHMVVYSAGSKRGYLTKKNIEQIKSILAKEIFHNDMYELYDEKTQARERIADEVKNRISDVLFELRTKDCSNLNVLPMLINLSERLKSVKGKKLYGYLPRNMKSEVDAIVRTIAEEPSIQRLYQEWCSVQNKIIGIYRSAEIEHPPLWENKEFKKIKNAVIAECVRLGNDEIFSECREMHIKFGQENIAEAESYETALPEPEERIYLSEPRCDYRGEYRMARKLMYQDKDFEAAFKILIRESEKNNAPACFDLGRLYQQGLFVEKDEERANLYFGQALQTYLELEQRNPSPFFEYQIGRLYNLDTDFQDYTEARRYFTLAAEKGNGYAMYALGNLYYYGKGVEIDYKKAFEQYTASAEQDVKYVYYRLGDMLRQGVGCEKNEAKSDYYFSMLIPDSIDKIDKENYLNCYRLGKLYERGWGTEVNFENAVKCYEAACLSEYPQAEYALGNLYYSGSGVEQNYEKALAHYLKCAEEKMPHVLYRLGKMYKDGVGCEANAEKSEYYFSELIRTNIDNITKENYLNCYMMGKLFEQGLGCEKNILTAVKCYETAGLANCPEADFALANLYYYGAELEQDYEKAYRLYKKCADKNGTYAYYRLGDMLRQGVGCEKNEAEADVYFRKLILENEDNLTRENHVNCYRIGRLYEKGYGVKADIEKAERCYLIACEAKNPNAEFALARLYFRCGDADNGEKYIQLAIEHENKYAEQWYKEYLEYLKRWDIINAADSALYLFCRLANMLAEDTCKHIDGHNKTLVDSKERRELRKKKQRLGIKMG